MLARGLLTVPETIQLRFEPVDAPLVRVAFRHQGGELSLMLGRHRGELPFERRDEFFRRQLVFGSKGVVRS